MKDDPIRGKTIRWAYTDGPTVGTKFEHTFAADGTVSYRMLDGKSAGASDGKGGEGTKGVEGGAQRPRYEVARVSDDVFAVSYLAPSGWALTTVLEMGSRKIVSFASNEKQLFVQHGTFEAPTPA